MLRMKKRYIAGVITVLVCGCLLILLIGSVLVGPVLRTEATARDRSSLNTQRTVADMASAEAADMPAADMEFRLASQPSVAQAIPDIQRQIIYRAQVSLIVENLGDVPKQVMQLIQQHDGYISQSNMTGNQGYSRSASWEIRIPAKQFQGTLDAFEKLGEVRSLSTTSEDVSETYYDLQSRIRNKEREEQRLLKHLDQSTRSLSEILTIERELSRVRAELESLQGRFQVLDNLASFSTISLQVHELTAYQPQQEASVGFGNQIATAWTNSTQSLLTLIQWVVVKVVVILPWGLMLLFVAAIVYGVVRLRQRRKIMQHAA